MAQDINRAQEITKSPVFSWGINYQYNLSKIHPDWKDSDLQKNLGGWGAGVWLRRSKKNTWNYGFSYLQKGFIESSFQRKFSLQYVDVNVSPLIELNNFFIRPGLFYSFLIKRKLSLNSNRFELEDFKKNNVGANIGVGFFLLKRIEFEINYRQGIISIYDNKHLSTSGAFTGDKTPYRTRSLAFIVRLNFGK